MVDAIQSCDGFDDALVLPMQDLSSNERDILRERWIISSELLTKQEGCGVVVLENEQMAVMVNEEDHLRLQCTRSGLRLRASLLRLATPGRCAHTLSTAAPLRSLLL